MDVLNKKQVKVKVGGNGKPEYSGGENAEGRLFAGKDEKEVVFEVWIEATDYAIAGIEFSADPFNQLWWEYVSRNMARIHDSNKAVMEATYCVRLRDAAGNITLCDPMIANEPRG